MNKEIINKIVDRTIDIPDTSWGMDINKWDWVPGVGMYGIVRVLLNTDNSKIENFIKNWINKYIHKAYEVKVVNSCIPMLTVLEYYMLRGGENYFRICHDTADWMITDAPLTRDGGLEHTVTENAEFQEQIWADTLFMACLFLAKFGKFTGERKYSDFAIKQFAIHYKFLKDKDTKLCYHGWNGADENHMSGAYWARANAWIIASTAELLEMFGEFPERDYLLSELLELIEAVCRCQHKNGMFSTVLDKDYYDEASATAGIAYGIMKAVKQGFIPRKYLSYAHKALNAVKGAINEIGEVGQVSGGTAIQPTIEAYNDIPIYPALYGQALALLMLCEED